MKEITSFSGEYRFLSNFYPCEVEYEGILYSTVEHAYQASKSLDPRVREVIRDLPTPGKAKRSGFAIVRRDDWTDVNIGIMRDLLVQKFTKEPFKSWLIKTGDVKLIEGNDWGDTHWGKIQEDGGKWRGENHLGELLMMIRDEFNGKVL